MCRSCFSCRKSAKAHLKLVATGVTGRPSGFWGDARELQVAICFIMTGCCIKAEHLDIKLLFLRQMPNVSLAFCHTAFLKQSHQFTILVVKAQAPHCQKTVSGENLSIIAFSHSDQWIAFQGPVKASVAFSSSRITVAPSEPFNS